MTDLLCPACSAPKQSMAPVCKRCLRAVPWPLITALWSANRNLRKHPDEAGAKARYRAARAAVIRGARGNREPSPEPAA